MTSTTRVPSTSPYADRIGFSAAVRSGDTIHVSGMTALRADGAIAGGEDPYEQARAALAKIDAALRAAGASAADVVRTRIYVTERSYAEPVGRAHGETFGDAKPAATMVVAQLLDPRMKVEIEATAHLTGAAVARDQATSVCSSE
ncbi:MAG TPA: Rid family hydrolase [Solirubrobacteraceae bacterium]|jgi:enamine deaminase RidA (YjgF/YER057c/UK114 family)|nr:Rid family hydrolase [Solirubrobacteraceae bacterium]